MRPPVAVLVNGLAKGEAKVHRVDSIMSGRAHVPSVTALACTIL